MPTLKVWDGSQFHEIKGDKGDPGEVTNAALESRVSPIEDRVTTVEDASAPLQSGFAPQQMLIPDDVGLGWFQGPVLVANWAPYKAEGTGQPMSARMQSFFDAVGSTGIPGALLPGMYSADAPLDVQSYSTLYGHGVVLTNDAPGSTDRTIRIHDRDHVRLVGFEFDGKKSSFSGTTEQRHNIDIRGSRWITLEDIYTHDAKGDGVLIGRLIHTSADGINPDGPVNEHITLHRVRSDANHRQGMSISKARHVHAYDSAFTNTSGTPPECGVDVEPDQDYYPVDNIQLVRCILAGNTGHGFVAMLRATPTVPQRRIKMVECDIHENGFSGVSFNRVKEGLVRDSDVWENTLNGVEFTGETDDSTVRGGQIRRNGRYGFAMFSSSGAPQRRNSLIDATVRDNGQTSNDPGVSLQGATIYDAIIRGNRIGGTSQRRAVESTSGTPVHNLTMENNDLTGNGTEAVRWLGTHTGDHIRNNRGYVTEASGTQEVVNGDTIVHGLSAPPTVVTGNAGSAGHIIAFVNPTTNSVTVSIRLHDGTIPASPIVVRWEARV